MVFCSQRATEMLSLYTQTLPSVRVLCMKRAWPAPPGHQRTRQWLQRSVNVLPPSALKRMKEFSPVMRSSFGSTGGGMCLSLQSVGAQRDATRYSHPVTHPSEDTGDARSRQAANRKRGRTAMSKHALYVLRMDVAHDLEKVGNEVYETEHVPLFAAVPGEIRA